MLRDLFHLSLYGRVLLGFLASPGRKQNIQQLFLGHFFGLQFNRFLLFGPHHVDGQFRQVPHHRFHITADITHFREFAGFDFQKGRLRQARQPACDFRFAHAGRTDHDDIFRGDFVAQMIGDLLPAPAVAKRNGHHPFGFLLPDDVFIQFAHDLRRSKGLLHGFIAPQW